MNEAEARARALVNEIVYENIGHMLQTLADECQLTPELREELNECFYPVLDREEACKDIAIALVAKIQQEEAEYVPEEGEELSTDINVKSDTASWLSCDYDIEHEDIDQLAEALNDLDDDQLREVARKLADIDLDYYTSDPLEFWSVTDDGRYYLERVGEKVVEFLGFNVWCRTTSGQAIAQDYCIQRILKGTN